MNKFTDREKKEKTTEKQIIRPDKVIFLSNQIAVLIVMFFYVSICQIYLYTHTIIGWGISQ